MRKADNENSFLVKLDPKTIEAVWADHVLTCERCAQVDVDKSVTLKHACPEGSQYVKVILRKQVEPQLAAQLRADLEQEKKMRGEYYASKRDVAAAMRYKQ
jgi:hypothetical protein